MVCMCASKCIRKQVTNPMQKNPNVPTSSVSKIIELTFESLVLKFVMIYSSPESPAVLHKYFMK